MHDDSEFMRRRKVQLEAERARKPGIDAGDRGQDDAVSESIEGGDISSISMQDMVVQLPDFLSFIMDIEHNYPGLERQESYITAKRLIERYSDEQILGILRRSTIEAWKQKPAFFKALNDEAEKRGLYTSFGR